jgi:hypothetical protein
VKWKYNAKKDEYSPKHRLLLDMEPLENENLHFCDKCLELWKQGGFNEKETEV